MSFEPAALAREISAAYLHLTPIVTPSSRDASFDVATAHAVEAELVKLGRASGRRTVGQKVGFANKAMWRVLKLQTLVWAAMYEDTVTLAPSGEATMKIGRRYSPRIEPEIVFKLKSPLAGTQDAAEALAAVEWMALGFEIIDCPFADWKFQPADFVAAYGLHAALVVGTPVPVTPANIATIADALPSFALKLSKGGALVEEGSGKNSLRSPALCLGELAGAIARQPGATPLAAGDLVSTGTLTAAQPITTGDIWRAEIEKIDKIDGLDLKPLTLSMR